MRVPSPAELAAIATAYLALARRARPAPPPASRWRLAARLGGLRDASAARSAARRSRWNAAGRRDA